MRIGEEARKRRLVTVELIPDRVNPSELTLLKGKLDAITIPALRNGFHDPSYPTSFRVTPQQRSFASALIVSRTGLEAVPSITCRDCRTGDLAGLSRLVEEGLENLLAVYGDRFGNGQDVYEFSRTDALIRHVKSSYPEGLSVGAITNQYSRNSEDEVERTLARVEAGADFVLTNTAFDEELVLDHRDRLLAAGLEVPMLLQVSIPHSLENLEYVSRKFGIPVPERLVRKLRRDPSAGIEFGAETFEALRLEAEGIHFSYLLRKRNPIPTYCRLLERIHGETVPVPISSRTVQEVLPGH